MIEIWTPVTYRGSAWPYEVSNLGRVRNKYGKVLKTRMRGQRNGTYPFITLCRNGLKRNVDVHRLCALHFVPNFERKREVNHIDNDNMNHSAWNLEWVTRSENEMYKYYPTLILQVRTPLSMAEELRGKEVIPF